MLISSGRGQGFKSCQAKLWSPWSYRNVFYIFRNLQSFPAWIRQAKSVSVHLVHFMLSGITLGLLHNITNECIFTLESVAMVNRSIKFKFGKTYVEGFGSRTRILLVCKRYELLFLPNPAKYQPWNQYW